MISKVDTTESYEHFTRQPYLDFYADELWYGVGIINTEKTATFMEFISLYLSLQSEPDFFNAKPFVVHGRFRKQGLGFGYGSGRVHLFEVPVPKV